MGYLTVFNETGFPHSGCFLEYTNGQNEWLGYFPRPGAFLGGNGVILTMSREDEIAHYVRFCINDALLRSARWDVVTKYWSEVYQIGTCDCVSFTRDLAEACRLQAFPVIMLSPRDLVFGLKVGNKGWTHFDADPFPWRITALLGQWSIRVHTWTWIYEFREGGEVQWTDPFNGMTGKGTWKLTRQSLKTSWAPDSKTTETWELPIDPKHSLGRCFMEEGTYHLIAVKMIGGAVPGR